jgi:hypothetical protein
VRLQNRLRRLEQAVGLGDDDCPACRDRRGFSLLVTRREGEEAPPDAWPKPCPHCGEVPERVIEIVTVVVTTHEEAVALR